MIYLLQLPKNSRKQTPSVLIEDVSERLDYKLFKKVFTTTSQVRSKYGAFVKFTDDQTRALETEQYAVYEQSLQFLRRAEIEYTIVESYDELPVSEERNDGTCGYCAGCRSGMNWCDNQ